MDQPARYVAYYRMQAVGAPDRDEALERQKQVIRRFLDGTEHDLVGEFTEVVAPVDENDRFPALGLSLHCALTFDATLIAALSDAAVTEKLFARTREAGIRILLLDTDISATNNATDEKSSDPAVDAPYLDLRGSRRPPAPVSGGRVPRPTAGNRVKADRFARAILPIIEQIRATGVTTLSDIADELNTRHIRTARGRRWYPTTVRNILNRRSDDA